VQTEQTGEQRQMAWSDIDWATAEALVRRLQGRIYRAAAAGNRQQVKNLQKLLVRSTSAKRLAVRRVTQQNAGHNTPGVDGVVCRTPESRMKLAEPPGLPATTGPTGLHSEVGRPDAALGHSNDPGSGPADARQNGAGT
jgi:N-terminal domain of reverse transcriptase